MPILVLLVPFLDVVLAIVRRTRRGQGIGYADKEHLHHHLMEIGHGHRQAVLLMYLWSALVSGCALAVAAIDGRFAVGLILFGGGRAVPRSPRCLGSRAAAGATARATEVPPHVATRQDA